MIKQSFLLIAVGLLGLSSAQAERIYPMTPIYSSSMLSKNFLGVQIPYEAIAAVGGNISEAQQQLDALGLYTYGSMGRIQITRNGRTLGSGVLGTTERYSGFVVESSSCWGICLEFGGSSNRGKTLKIGEKVTYGLNMDWTTGRSGDARSKSGIWITDPLSMILEYGDFIVHGETAMDVALKTAKYGNYRLKAEHRDPKAVDWPKGLFSFLSETKNQSRVVNPTNLVNSVVAKSSSLAKLFDKVRADVGTELKWKAELGKINGQAPVWANANANTLVQSICDSLHKSHQGPAQLAPRCSVFASLTPNAYAYPGGDIFVSAGLLGILPNVDTLIFFLSHEYTHIIAQHTTKRMAKEDMRASILSTTALLTNVAAMGTSSSLLELTKAMGVRQLSMESIRFAVNSSLAEHTRDQEDEADEMGIEMAMNLGAHPLAVIQGLKAVETYCDDTFKKKQTGVLNDFMTADHNELQDRLGKIESHAASYAGKVKGKLNLARTLDAQFTPLQTQLKALSNYYRLNLKSLQ